MKPKQKIQVLSLIYKCYDSNDTNNYIDSKFDNTVRDLIFYLIHNLIIYLIHNFIFYLIHNFVFYLILKFWILFHFIQSIDATKQN